MMDGKDLVNEEKEELLALLLEEEGLTILQELAITPRERVADVPLSFAQQRLWVLDQLELGNASYAITLAARLTGLLHVAAMEHSLNEIVRRHEALRTIFISREGQSVQIVVPPGRVVLPIVDLRGVSESERESEAQRLITQDAQQLFDLSHGPLIRACALRLEAEEHLLLLMVHHIVADGWSMGVLMRELGILYQAFVVGKPSSLPELPIQYIDYALWQREQPQLAVFEEQLTYWKQQLQDSPSTLGLSTDRPRPSVQTFRGVHIPLTLSRELSERLKALSRQQEATLFMTLLAAFKVLLARHSGQEDIVVGTPVAGRTRSELEPLIGFFLNTLVLRTDLSGQLSFLDVLQRVRQVTVDAYAHQDVPFEYLLQTLQVERSLSHTPLFQVFFNMLNLPNYAIGLPGLSVEVVLPAEVPSRFDLTLYVKERQERLMLELVYNADLFEHGRMAELLEQLHVLLQQIVEHPQEHILHFSLVTAAARAVLPDPTEVLNVDWYGAIHTHFSLQAQRVPDRVAVVDAHSTWSYQELDRRSNQLAQYLRSRDIQLRDRVVIYGTRNAALICAVLGILKAGAVFVILDPAYPAARLLSYVEMVRPRGCIEIEEAGPLPELLEGYMETLPGCARLTLSSRLGDAAHTLLQGASIENPQVPIGPDDMACISFTSGSTGRPKGVLGRHGPLTHFLPWQVQTFDLREDDHFSMLSGLSHDPLQRDIFTPLWLGATIYSPTPDEIGTPGRLARWMHQQQISVTHLTPAMIHLLTQSVSGTPALNNLPSLRHALILGDAVTRSDVVQLRKIALTVTCVSSYGSTETQRAVGYFLVPDQANEPKSGAKERLPVGRGMKDVQLLVLRDDLQLTGIGEVGEIYVRSPHLAKGYLEDEPLTRERFLLNPFTRVEGDRLYKTGDLGCYLLDGTVEFLGRRDHQVKLRGFRIELGEIEAVLRRSSAVRDCLVMLREDIPGEKRLVAYIVASRNQNDAAPDLRRMLKEQLPEYMVPTAYIFLEQLPLTPNGKIDRRALPPPDVNRQEAFVTARTPIEEVLVALWAQILHLNEVGIHDNFFELGGHSLLALDLINRLREAFQVDLSLRSLFETPTVADQAEVLTRLKGRDITNAQTHISWPRITPRPDQLSMPFPLTDVQQAYWIGRMAALELGNVARHFYVELECAALDLQRLSSAWQRVIERHAMLRAIVLPDGQQQILQHVPPYEIATLDLRGKPPAEVAARLEAIRQSMSHQMLATDRWPLFDLRATYLDDGQVRLHLSAEALMIDSGSWQILWRELSLLYYHPEIQPAPLELSFRDYVLAEIAFRASDAYRRSQDYWRDRLATLPPAPELPLLHHPASLTEPRFVRQRARLEVETWSCLKQKAARAGLTPSAVLLAAFAEILSTWSKQPRFTLNLTLFNRLPLHPQAGEILGDFTSLTLLEVDHSQPGSFVARARRLQERLWEDLDHRYVSGVHVLRELQRVRQGTLGAVMPVVFTSMLTQQQLTAPVPSPLGRVIYNISQTPQVWLDHQVFEQGGALHFNWDAVEELFPPGLLGDMFEAYERFLLRLVTSDESWSEVPRYLVPFTQLEQRARINATTGHQPQALLHDLFTEQVPLCRDHAAVIAPGCTLTYETLERTSTRLGKRLRRLGAVPNTLVAVVMEKGWEQVVAVLGILKSGAAYLPIDAALPTERLWYLLQHGQVRIVLTQSRLASALPWPQEIQLERIDYHDLSAEGDPAPLRPIQHPEDLAYVIYTSGSTGQPKGVMIDHRGAVNTILDINQRFGVGRQDRLLALSSLSFDLSVYDLFGTLAAGGTIVFPETARRQDPAHWTEVLIQERITLWNSVPTLMEMLIEYLVLHPAMQPDSLRLVLLSGDWIPLLLPEQIKTLANDIQVVSLGGATEASIWSILYPISTVDPSWRSIPYGLPMRNQQFHVLNDALEPCPVWVPGQLYIGGLGLAKGYWRDEENTHSSFIIHPQTGDRLYRTGDLGRYLPDGTLELLGREDFQVKIQGHRIELGEIEATLLQHPVVRQAVVVALGDREGGKRLVAYVVPEQKLGLAPAQRQQSGNGPRLYEADDPDQQRHVFTNSLDRLLFTIGQPGLRPEEPEKLSVFLHPLERNDTRMQAYLQRQSHRRFRQAVIPLKQFSELLGCLAALELEEAVLPKYCYPSAGGLYPVQVYISIKAHRVEGLEAGIYYYHPKDHRLVLLSPHAVEETNIHAPTNILSFEESAFSLFLIGYLDAIAPLYSDHARDFCLLEAGYMGQLLMSVAPRYQIGLCPIGTLNFTPIRSRFALQESHQLLHSFVGGLIEPVQIFGGDRDVSLEEALRGFLQAKLPAYMVPGSFYLLETLPLTANGKIDRKALPEPSSSPVARVSALQHAPGGELLIVEQVTRVVIRVLHLDALDPSVNILNVGANSIDMVRIVNALERELNFRPSLVEFFRSPTIADLVRAYEGSHHQSQRVEAAPQAFASASDEREEGEL
jgi:amino acid adenylation domain-containing protein